MKVKATVCAILPGLFASLPVGAQTWINDQSPATIVELFTSEGCSSCPPAEDKLNQLKSSKGLWTLVIPLAFHVDYWNYIGWKDRFSKRDYSDRQREKVSAGQAKGVYTPGWFINNQEWRGFFARQKVPFASGSKAGILKASLDDQSLTVNYDQPRNYTVNIALLAMNESTEVKRGENAGRSLEHEFIVVDFASYYGKNEWQHTISNELSAQPDAVAVWLEQSGSNDPVQTVAGLINRP
ncbi:DUF1223 domain-containing protein [Veronia pacifica]|uniref:DUF1223 domain-containing protein n=1 Tax=Veronia pacifica TaxID=1080227 RepID=A0A1C3ESU2_9GAMM|nr:DUF1223 domain-containing protein [Veronia pacifica]ODA36213.1 hypothetical protein A8L45_01005 [Veronia pacifica]